MYLHQEFNFLIVKNFSFVYQFSIGDFFIYQQKI